MKTVKKTASSLDGVEKADVDFKAKRLTVIMKEGKSLKEKTLLSAFEDTRFTVKEFKQTQGGEEEASESATYKATISGMT